jgi:hypothetical protein
VKLGEAFLVAKENVEKARSGPEFQLISFAAIGIRDVVNKIWQGLCYQARQSCPDKLKGYPQLEIKSEPARQVVAECFGTDDITIQKCKYFLDKLFDIHNMCSASDFGKDILNKDLERLNSIYTTWITAIDELIKLLRI